MDEAELKIFVNQAIDSDERFANELGEAIEKGNVGSCCGADREGRGPCNGLDKRYDGYAEKASLAGC